MKHFGVGVRQLTFFINCKLLELSQFTFHFYVAAKMSDTSEKLPSYNETQVVRDNDPPRYDATASNSEAVSVSYDIMSSDSTTSCVADKTVCVIIFLMVVCPLISESKLHVQ